MTSPTRRRTRAATGDSATTRETLLRLAALSFGTQGYAATTMRAIAEQAGIEAASIYYHFDSKEELVGVVMEQGAEGIIRYIESYLEALPPGAGAELRLRSAVLGHMSALIEHGDYVLAHGRLLSQLPDQVRDHHNERRERYQGMWQSLLEDLRAEGLVREDVDLALCRVFLLRAINSPQQWFDPRKGSLERVADQFCRLFFDGVRPRA